MNHKALPIADFQLPIGRLANNPQAIADQGSATAESGGSIIMNYINGAQLMAKTNRQSTIGNRQ